MVCGLRKGFGMEKVMKAKERRMAEAWMKK